MVLRCVFKITLQEGSVEGGDGVCEEDGGEGDKGGEVGGDTGGAGREEACVADDGVGTSPRAPSVKYAY